MKKAYYFVLYHTLMSLQKIAVDAPRERALDDMGVMVYSALSYMIF